MVEAELKRRDDIRTQFNSFLDLVFERGRKTNYDLGDLARAGRQGEIRDNLSQITPARAPEIAPLAMDNALALAVALDQSLSTGSIGSSLDQWARRGRI